MKISKGLYLTALPLLGIMLFTGCGVESSTKIVFTNRTTNATVEVFENGVELNQSIQPGKITRLNPESSPNTGADELQYEFKIHAGTETNIIGARIASIRLTTFTWQWAPTTLEVEQGKSNDFSFSVSDNTTPKNQLTEK